MSPLNDERADLSMAAELDRLWTKYRPINAARLREVEAAARAVSSGSAEGIAEGIRAAHKLAGSLGMFGRPAASTMAREAEEILSSAAPDAARVLEIIAAIRAEVLLPDEARPSSPPPVRTQAATMASVDVALIEDDEVVAGLLTYALNKQGYTTHWINDGGAALRTLSGDTRSLSARVIVLDVDLPGIDGLTLLRRFAAEDLLRESPVIMLTVRSAESEVVKALQLGAIDHVAKPFSLRVFLEKIRRTLNR